MGRGGRREGAGRKGLAGDGSTTPKVPMAIPDHVRLALERYAEEHGAPGKPLPIAQVVRELAEAWGDDAKVQKAHAAWRKRREALRNDAAPS